MPTESTFRRFVEVGRIVLITDGPHSGKIATIAEIIDHNRAIVDGPLTGVPRQSLRYRNLLLTPLTIPLPRAARTGTVRKVFEKSGVVEKWEASSWAKKRAAIQARRQLDDFGRFQVMVEKKRRRDAVRKALRKAKA
ncbi:hypothetical protein FRC03_010854 [Tulasnella sp. 419]|nr:hypothetical protein FRC02_012218 [Tulasnella sp. 418]KAG8956432.1 hypothetical protein FRC03_010854 [Tulasnella sp. 419]